ncbi:unnamed protein product [Pipistrellus nathusii]|uniref:Uncharacterized protein n=1 Tax=Pipistrellus nathusii TaxID=59473 RepID=A0ABN9ZR64_PIPNA
MAEAWQSCMAQEEENAGGHWVERRPSLCLGRSCGPARTEHKRGVKIQSCCSSGEGASPFHSHPELPFVLMALLPPSPPQCFKDIEYHAPLSPFLSRPGVPSSRGWDSGLPDQF